MKIIGTDLCCEVLAVLKEEIVKDKSEAIKKDAVLFMIDKMNSFIIEHSVDTDEK